METEPIVHFTNTAIMLITTSSLNRTTCTLFTTHKSHPNKFFVNPVSNHNVCSLQTYLRTGPPTLRHNDRLKMDFVVYSTDQAGDLIPLGTTLFDSWTNWLPGLLIPFILPFFTNKWGPFAKLKERIDNAVNTVEEVTDVIEDLANKVAEDISDDLPDGGKLRQAADFVEDVAERIAKDAHWVGDCIDKVEELEEKVESLIETVDTDHQPPKTQVPNSNAQQLDKN